MTRMIRVPWSGDKKRDSGRDTVSSKDTRIPRWVDWFTDGGRPVVAMIVMTMCAPGEHRLARMAGWREQLDLAVVKIDLAWGMPACLVAYAGIASVVATKRDWGAPGKRSAIVGAIVALMLAMAAQPISHLYVTGWLSAAPHAPWILVVITSCVPPLVLGHLFHLAASPASLRVPRAEDSAVTEDKPEDTKRDSRKDRRRNKGQTVVPLSPEDSRVPATVSPVPAAAEDKDSPAVPVPAWVTEGRTHRVLGDMNDALSASVSPAEDTESVPLSLTKDKPGDIVPDELKDKRNLTDLVLSIYDRGTTDSQEIKDTVLSLPGWEDTKNNSLNKSISRVRDKRSAA